MPKTGTYTKLTVHWIKCPLMILFSESFKATLSCRYILFIRLPANNSRDLKHSEAAANVMAYEISTAATELPQNLIQ